MVYEGGEEGRWDWKGKGEGVVGGVREGEGEEGSKVEV